MNSTSTFKALALMCGTMISSGWTPSDSEEDRRERERKARDERVLLAMGDDSRFTTDEKYQAPI